MDLIRLIFMIFTLVTLIFVGVTTYLFQNILYKQHVEEQAKEVAGGLDKYGIGMIDLI